MKKHKIIITAGGTSEYIDKVRKITNSSSGKLGMLIAKQLLETRNDIETIYYICPKNALKPNSPKVKIIEITGTIDLKNTVEELLTKYKIDYFIHSMAVSDYMVDYVTNINLLSQSIKEHPKNNIVDTIKNNTKVLTGNKLSSKEDNLVIIMKPTPKIISLIKTLSPKTFLVGFKLLDDVSENQLINVAKNLRDKNKCDLVIANDLENIKNGSHKAFIIDKNDEYVIAYNKDDIAKKLVKKMYNS